METGWLDDLFTSRGHIVKPEWIDAYDHMNMSRYVALFDDVTYDLLDRVDLGLAYTKRTRHGLFIVDARVRFLRELRVGTPLEVKLRLVGADHVRLHMWLELRAAGSDTVHATQEQIGLHADLDRRRTAAFAETVLEKLQQVVSAHRAEPEDAQRVLSMRCSDGAGK
ncbi:thioesterase family protein [Variovorax sp. LjRoot84]|uniref:thioesterase family protein n=1 Tax=Variovorax sp. LjRoot84 TaxID=3342340 RepID=UPI003ECCAE9C